MGLIALPSIVAIAAKITVVLLGRRSLLKANKSLLLFLSAILGVNIFELALIFKSNDPGNAFSLLLLYYCCALTACASLLVFTLQVKEVRNRYIDIAVALTFSLAMMVTSVPGMAIDNAVSIGYSITREPGAFYPIIQVFLLGGCLTIIGVIVSCIRDKRKEVRNKGMVLATSISPLALSVIAVIVAMQIGAKINAAIFISLTTSFMMLVLIAAESHYGLFKLLCFIPKTQESRQLKTVTDLLNDPSLSLKEAEAAFSALMVERAVARSEGNLSEAARMLKVSRSTIHRKK